MFTLSNRTEPSLKATVGSGAATIFPDELESRKRQTRPRAKTNERTHAVGVAKAYNGGGCRLSQFRNQGGEIVGLLGPNGRENHDISNDVGCCSPEGKVVLNDEIYRAPIYQRARAGISYLPQESSVFSPSASRISVPFWKRSTSAPKNAVSAAKLS